MITQCMRCGHDLMTGMVCTNPDCNVARSQREQTSDNVVALKPVQVKAPFEPQAGLIKMAEELLVEAKSGKLRGFLYAKVVHDDLTECGAVSYDWDGTHATLWAMDRALGLLDWRWKAHVNKKD